MNSRLQSTENVHPAYRLDAWQKMIEETFAPVETQVQSQADNFTGRIESIALGCVSLSAIKVHGGRIVHRTPHHIAKSRGSAYFLEIPLCGQVTLEHCGHRGIADSEGMFLIDADQVTTAKSELVHHSLSITIHAQQMRRFLGNPEDYCGRVISTRDGLPRVLKNVVVSVFDEASNIDPTLLSAVGKEIVELIVLALQSRNPARPVAVPSVKWAHLARARSYISINLHEPNLSPTVIAEALGLSTRYLGSVFQLTEFSVMEWLLEERLNRCLDMLNSSRFDKHSISEIAYESGFRDAHNFAKCFKRRFGVTPRDFRLSR